MTRPLAALATVLVWLSPAFAQPKEQAKLPDAKVLTADHVYKKTAEGELTLHCSMPADWKASDRRPVIVFFFGGGWKNGSFTQFVPQAEYFAGRGIVAISADYRIESKHKTKPDRAVEDAKTAIGWVRANAAKLGIDPEKVIASGGSAGGHLAAATALVEKFESPDDPKASCKPNALVLFNPFLNGKGRTIAGSDGSNIAEAMSPTLFLKKGAPPCILFYGTKDPMLDQGKEFAAKCKEHGVKCELYIAADQPHGFFNRAPWLHQTTRKADEFLTALGYLKGEPTLKPPADAPELKNETPRDAREAVERGLAFLQQDSVKWREDRKCATCHHGTMTVWALSEAKSRGYAVDKDSFADVVKWTKERLKDIDKPRDTRPGWNMVSTPAVFLSMMALAVPKQDALSADELKKIGGHLLRHQEADGSWAWSLAPAKNRPPPVFESDEVVTLMAYLALGPQVPADPKTKSDARDGREKAVTWLEKNRPTKTTQAQAVRLFRDVRAGKTPKELQPQIDALLKCQNKDGGWGQDRDLPSDAFATGQALYFLALAGVKPDRDELQRGVAFLVATQKTDGSWPMKSRAHPGEKPMTNPVPITYFGSAWATLGLLRAISK